MMRSIILAVMLALTSLSSAHATTISDAAKSTYKLFEGTEGICSVTFLRNDAEGAIFLTAAHCVAGKGLNVRVQKFNDKLDVVSESIYYVKSLRVLKEQDTALIQTTDKIAPISTPNVDIATKEEAAGLKMGDEVVVLGFPAADQLALTEGKFTAKVKGVLGTDYQYQTTAPVAGGNSGGGLYAKFGEEWKLIGTTSAKRNDNEIMTYFSTTEAVEKTVAGFLNKTQTVPALNTLPSGRVDEK